MQLIQSQNKNSRLSTNRQAAKQRKTSKGKTTWNSCVFVEQRQRHSLSPLLHQRKTGPHVKTEWPWKRFPHHKKMFVLYTLSPTPTHTQKKKKKKKIPKHSKCFSFFLSAVLSRYWPEFVPSSLAAVPDAELLPASAASAKWVRPLSVCWYWFHTADIAAVCV